MTIALDLKAVKSEAMRKFGAMEGVEGFGIGDRVLRIYVRHASVKEMLPREFQGVPVEIIVTGDIIAG